MTDNHGYYNRKNESDQFHESHDVNTSEVIQAPISERTDPLAPKPESAPDNRNKRPPEETSSGGEQVDRDANPPNPSPPDEDPFDSDLDFVIILVIFYCYCFFFLSYLIVSML